MGLSGPRMQLKKRGEIYQTTGGILSYRHLPLSICWSFQNCLWNLLLQMSQTNGRVWKHLMLFLCLLRLQLFLNKTIWTWTGRDTDKLVFRVGHIHFIKLLCDNVSIKRNEFTFVFFQSSLWGKRKLALLTTIRTVRLFPDICYFVFDSFISQLFSCVLHLCFDHHHFLPLCCCHVYLCWPTKKEKDKNWPTWNWTWMGGWIRTMVHSLYKHL